MFGRKRQESQPEPKQPAKPAVVDRAQREADALRAAARKLPDIDPADAEYW